MIVELVKATQTLAENKGLIGGIRQMFWCPISNSCAVALPDIEDRANFTPVSASTRHRADISSDSGLPYNLAMHTYTISLRISSLTLDVAQVTKELNLAPTQTRHVGARKSANAVWDKALWELEVLPEGRSDWDSLEAGLAVLLNTFVPRANTLHEYSRKHDVFIWCGHLSSSLDGGPHLSAQILKSLGDFGVPRWFDTYFPRK
jgi:hypothetical protein